MYMFYISIISSKCASNSIYYFWKLIVFAQVVLIYPCKFIVFILFFNLLCNINDECLLFLSLFIKSKLLIFKYIYFCITRNEVAKFSSDLSKQLFLITFACIRTFGFGKKKHLSQIFDFRLTYRMMNINAVKTFNICEVSAIYSSSSHSRRASSCFES